MTMTIVTIADDGSAVIPEEILRDQGLKPGDRLYIMNIADRIAIVPVAKDPIAAGRGLLKGGPSLTAKLLSDRRRELEEEDRDLTSRRSGGK